MRFNLFLPFLFLLSVSGCGSSSESETQTPNEPVSDVTTPDIPPPGDTETPTEIQEIACQSTARLTFVEALADDEMTNYDASKVIDGQFVSQSRWSTRQNEQAIILTLAETSLVKGIAITWLNEEQISYSYDVETSQDNITWQPVLTSQNSDASSTRSEYVELTQTTANYVKITARGNVLNNGNHIVEAEAFGCFTEHQSDIALNDWYLSIPVDEATNTKSQSIYESVLTDNYFHAEFFFIDTEGGLVFRSPIEGAKTSTNTSYTRTELREMLRSGDTSIRVQGINKNNWVFSSASTDEQEAAGGVDGELVAELAVNYVTETGTSAQVGRVIIGQIHANDDEPIRVYYRKLPQNDKGAIYLAHEILDGDDIYYELIGTRSQSAANPENGIELNERFGYTISVVGNSLTFTLRREGQEDIATVIDMNDSGYDQGGQYMYFKAGVYNQNNTGDPKDYVQATFYRIDNSHQGYSN
ncbi:polysaccharide lyase family 7 protein [Thalassotalea sp. PLHSN55]|uniref:polysaccharide lyase family 7 protein n=1 Tax=Thalassotalea sp. PLHSN55 TaxID=3435888 RepID=UPI003F82AA7B